MSIVNVKEDYSVREATLSSDAYTARRRFTVLSDSIEDGPVVARQASGVPRIGDAHPNAAQLLVTSLPTKPVGNSHHLFEVIAEYSVPTTSFGSIEGDPLDKPTVVRWGSVSSTEPFDQDADGAAVQNTADESFDPALVDDFDDPVLTITRNEAVFDPNTLVIYNGAINSDTFYGAPAGEAKMLSIAAERIIVGATVAYWSVTYTIQFRFYHPNQTAEQAWQKRVRNEGYQERLVAGGNPVVAKDDKQQTFTSPIPLAADGTRLPEGAAKVWLIFKPPRWRQVAFAPLGLE